MGCWINSVWRMVGLGKQTVWPGWVFMVIMNCFSWHHLIVYHVYLIYHQLKIIATLATFFPFEYVTNTDKIVWLKPFENFTYSLEILPIDFWQEFYSLIDENNSTPIRFPWNYFLLSLHMQFICKLKSSITCLEIITVNIFWKFITC